MRFMSLKNWIRQDSLSFQLSIRKLQKYQLLVTRKGKNNIHNKVSIKYPIKTLTQQMCKKKVIFGKIETKNCKIYSLNQQ